MVRGLGFKVWIHPHSSIPIVVTRHDSLTPFESTSESWGQEVLLSRVGNFGGFPQQETCKSSLLVYESKVFSGALLQWEI